MAGSEAGAGFTTGIATGIAGIALWGPGLAGWDASRAVLRGEAGYAALDTPPPAPAILPANERRRASAAVRLALHVADAAVAMAAIEPARLRAVFGSANGDGPVVCGILESLAAGADVSPTAFHNSVHNAAAGYWTIGHGSRQPATCLGCHDATAAATLLKAVAEQHAEDQPVLACITDGPLPPPMAARRPTIGLFGAALVLTGPAGALGRISVRLTAARETPPRTQSLQPLAAGNPAARILPLLELVARGAAGTVCLPYLDGSLQVDYAP